MKIINQKHKTRAGYAILELLFYVSFFAVLSLLVINSMIIMTKSFKETSVQAELMQGGSIMEKISRDIRQANNFSYASNVLTLNIDNAGSPKTITFTFANPNMQVTDSVLGSLGNLNSPNISVTAFAVTSITTTEGKAVKIVLTIRSNNDTLGRTVNFYNTVVLRDSY